MKKKKTKSWQSLLVTFMFILSFAATADDLRLGAPGYGGNGCPSGSAEVILSPDQKSLSLIFDEFLVEASRRKRIARKSCNIAIPVHVPQGYSISLLEADYRGFVSLPRGAQARFTTEYFFAGKRGPRFSKTFRGVVDEDFTLSKTLGLEALVWSPCGADVNLRVNASMMVRTTRDDAIAMVDSADFNAGVVYHLKWKRCGSQDNYNDYNSWGY